MKTDWFRDTPDDKEKAQRRADLLANRRALDLLRPILEKKLADLNSAERLKANYEFPNWACYQADLVGCKRTLAEILDLVTLEKE